MTFRPTHQECLLSGKGNDSALLLTVLLGFVEGLQWRREGMERERQLRTNQLSWQREREDGAAD